MLWSITILKIIKRNIRKKIEYFKPVDTIDLDAKKKRKILHFYLRLSNHTISNVIKRSFSFERPRILKV